MSALQEKREAIAAAVAAARGLGPAEGGEGADRDGVEAQVAALIAGRAQPEGEPVGRLLAEYRALATLRADEADARLAEQGEVFAPENDA